MLDVNISPLLTKERFRTFSGETDCVEFDGGIIHGGKI